MALYYSVLVVWRNNDKIMNCDKCKHYNWYYDYCDKWKCKVFLFFKILPFISSGRYVYHFPLLPHHILYG